MRALKNNWLRAILFSILGLGISFGANASTDNKNPKTVKKEVKASTLQTSFFYEYTSTSTAEGDIKNINNYVRRAANPCNGASDVCGILLPTDTGLDNHPDSDEFEGVAEQLWSSQSQQQSTSPQVVMKN